MRRCFMSAVIILVSVIMTVTLQPTRVLAETVEKSEETEPTGEKLPDEPLDDEGILPDGEIPNDGAPDGEVSTEVPSDEEISTEEPSDGEDPDDGDEIYLGEDIVDKLRGDEIPPAEEKETDHTDDSDNSQKLNSQKHYKNNTCRELPNTGEDEDLFIWKSFLLLSAAGAILLFVFALKSLFSGGYNKTL